MKLTDRQRAALARLAEHLGAATYLAGGVGVALHLGHRQSRDLDFFVKDANPEDFAEALAQVDGVSITSRAPGTLYLEVDGLAVSVIRYRYPQLDAHQRIEGVPVPVASMRDLICMKLSAIASRGALRDFWDLHAMMVSEAIALETALSWYASKYASEDIGHVVRSLAYFDDADAEPRPRGLTAERWQTVKADFRAWVRGLSVGA